MKLKNIRISTLLMSILLSGIILFNVACVVDPEDSGRDNDFTVGEEFDYSIDVNDQIGVAIDAINGPIDVVGVANSTKIEVRGVRKVSSDSDDDAREHLDDLEVHLYEKNRRVYLETEQPDNAKGRNYTVEYNLRIPSHLLLNIDNSNGDIEIEDMKNSVDVDLTNGKVEIEETVASLSVHLTNGTIDVAAILPDNGEHELATTNGAISYKVPNGTSADFFASVVNGNISVENLEMTSSNVSSKSVTGKLGAGNGKIYLKTVNGNIHVEGE